jgi:hypothetical protein
MPEPLTHPVGSVRASAGTGEVARVDISALNTCTAG